ncbi:hypothetical protein BST46_30225 [Mycobacterium timonense]|uniref:Uncharacterized protein n=1 Tax=Mycobacterium timonense TaxID=701043 RepID=A0ABX3TC90_9MYCO|nr:hypothetical protein BST46_30225 [Mycobacterium timonense]
MSTIRGQPQRFVVATQAYIACPTDPLQQDGTPHTIIGCGALIPDDRDDEGLVDCPECGIWFDPTKERDPQSA